MTSKEALELTILDYEKLLETVENDQRDKDVLKGLKECQQDLEILNIIKRPIFNKAIHKYVLDAIFKGKKFITIALPIRGDTDDIKKIKEWLENDK